MKTSFQIVNDSFARHVLGNHVTGDPAADAAQALRMNHAMRDKPTSCRLNKWAIFRSDGTATLATDLATIESGDERTSKEAFSDELLKLQRGVVFTMFTKAILTPNNLRATYDHRSVSICSPSGVETINVTDADAKHWLARAYREKRDAV